MPCRKMARFMQYKIIRAKNAHNTDWRNDHDTR